MPDLTHPDSDWYEIITDLCIDPSTGLDQKCIYGKLTIQNGGEIMDAREATRIVREYFESVKKIKFLFDVRSVEYDEDVEGWVISCDVQNVFDEEPISYEILVEAETGDIRYVEEIEE